MSRHTHTHLYIQFKLRIIAKVAPLSHFDQEQRMAMTIRRL